MLLHVNWSKLLDRLEVYAFLENLQDIIKDIPIYVSLENLCSQHTKKVFFFLLLQVALRLLDSDYPDEVVRSFATAMLESLTDEDLQDYLLQLTQVKWHLKLKVLVTLKVNHVNGFCRH